MAPNKPDRLLSNLELEVMQVIWTEPEGLTIRQVVDALNAGGSRRHAYTTIQTIMMILKRKGVVTSRAGDGRAHVYRAKLAQEEATRSIVGDLVHRLFGGRAEPLLAHLLDQGTLRPDELDALRRRIDEQLGPPSEERQP